jgi:hypothetical protein
MLATASLDKHVRVWDMSTTVDGRPACAAEKSLKVRPLIFYELCIRCASVAHLRLQRAANASLLLACMPSNSLCIRRLESFFV